MCFKFKYAKYAVKIPKKINLNSSYKIPQQFFIVLRSIYQSILKQFKA